jgi:holo-[acyl-carrier protein] synthase
MKPPLPFPLALNIGTDIVHLPRITRLISRPGGYLSRFTRRILTESEQADFRARFAVPKPQSLPSPPSPGLRTVENSNPEGKEVRITPDMARYLAGRFAAKEAARKAARGGASALGWKDVIVRVGRGQGKIEGQGKHGDESESADGRPEIVFLDRDGDGPGQLGRLSISHDGEYVIAMVMAAG